MNLKESYEANLDLSAAESIKAETLQKLTCFENLRLELTSTQFK